MAIYLNTFGEWFLCMTGPHHFLILSTLTWLGLFLFWIGSS